MRYGRRKIGPQFGTKIGRLVSVALTCGNRNDEAGYRKAVEEIYQMLDTVAEEAGFDTVSPVEEVADVEEEETPEPEPVEQAPKRSRRSSKAKKSGADEPTEEAGDESAGDS